VRGCGGPGVIWVADLCRAKLLIGNIWLIKISKRLLALSIGFFMRNAVMQIMIAKCDAGKFKQPEEIY